MAKAMEVDRKTYATCEAGERQSPVLLRRAMIYVRHVTVAQSIALHLIAAES